MTMHKAKIKNRDFSVDGSSLVFHLQELDSLEFAQKTAALVPSILDEYSTVTLDMSAVRDIKFEFAEVFFGMIAGEHLANGQVLYKVHDTVTEYIRPVIQNAVRKSLPLSMGGTAQIH